MVTTRQRTADENATMTPTANDRCRQGNRQAKLYRGVYSWWTIITTLAPG